MRLVRTSLLTGVATAFAVLLAGPMAGASTPVRAGSVTVVNAVGVATGQPVDVSIDEVLCALVGVEPGRVGALLTLPAGPHTVTVRASDGNCTGALLTDLGEIDIEAGVISSVVVHDDGSGPAARVDVTDLSPLPRCRVRVEVRVVGGSGPFDIEITRDGWSHPSIDVDDLDLGEREVEVARTGDHRIDITDQSTGVTTSVPVTFITGRVYTLTVNPGADEPVLIDTQLSADVAV